MTKPKVSLLRRQRLVAGLRLRDVAEATGINSTRVGEIERGDGRPPSSTELDRLSAYVTRLRDGVEVTTAERFDGWVSRLRSVCKAYADDFYRTRNPEERREFDRGVEQIAYYTQKRLHPHAIFSLGRLAEYQDVPIEFANELMLLAERYPGCSLAS